MHLSAVISLVFPSLGAGFWVLLLIAWIAYRIGVAASVRKKRARGASRVKKRKGTAGSPPTSTRPARAVVNREDVRDAIRISRPGNTMERNEPDAVSLSESSGKTMEENSEKVWTGSQEQMMELFEWMSKQCDSNFMHKAVASAMNPLYSYRRDMGVGALDFIEGSIRKRMEMKKDEVSLAAMRCGLRLVEKMWDISSVKDFKRWFMEKEWMAGYEPGVPLVKSAIPVPYWRHHYVYSASEIKTATREQKKFYDYFRYQFVNGTCIDVEGNSNYPFVLLFDLKDEYLKTEEFYTFKQRMDLLSKAYDITEKYAQAEVSKIEDNLREKRFSDLMQDVVSRKDSEARWVPLGSAVEINGRKTTRGGFYLGKYLRVPSENAPNARNPMDRILWGPVVDPDCPVSSEGGDQGFTGYLDMSPSMRARYLDWLSGVTPVSGVNRDYLKCYLLGVEYRLFIDKGTGEAERSALLASLTELKEGLDEQKDYQLNNYVDTLIDSCLLRFFRKNWREHIPHLPANYTGNLLDYIITALPKDRLTVQETVDLAWSLFGLDGLLTPSLDAQLKEKASALCRQSVAQNRVRQKGTPCTLRNHLLTQFVWISPDLTYRPESKDIVYLVSRDHVHQYGLKNLLWTIVSHVYRITKSARSEARKAGGCTPYSLFLLPSDLIDIREDESVKALGEEMKGSLDVHGQRLMRVNDFLSRIGYVRDGDARISKSGIDCIRDGIRRLGIGVAPDLSLGDKRYAEGDWLCLYRLADGTPPEDNDGSMALSRFLVRMAASLAVCDGEKDGDFPLVQKGLESLLSDRRNIPYLLSLFRFYTVTESSLPRPQCPEDIDASAKKTISEVLIRMLFIGGDISTKRMNVLKKYFDKLDIDPVGVHSRIHELMTVPVEETFATIEKVEGKDGYSIPGPSSRKKTFKIDEHRLEDVQEQTGKAQSLLSEIFRDDDGKNEEAEGSAPGNPVQDILAVLLTRASWAKEEVGALCKERGLMTGFVLEEINNLSYEKVDDAVVEDDGDTVYVMTEYKDRLI